MVFGVCECRLTPLNSRYPLLDVVLRQGERFRFGRHEGCDMAFPKDFRISSVHASLLVELAEDGGLRVAIEDSSVNGTFVNGQRVPRGMCRALFTGDEIFLVIPSQMLLQGSGYEGSLIANFVGYSFTYTGESARASLLRQPASRAAPASAAEPEVASERSPSFKKQMQAEVRAAQVEAETLAMAAAHGAAPRTGSVATSALEAGEGSLPRPRVVVHSGDLPPPPPSLDRGVAHPMASHVQQPGPTASPTAAPVATLAADDGLGLLSFATWWQRNLADDMGFGLTSVGASGVAR